MGTMAMDRKLMEAQIVETEAQHRYASSLLRPRGLYRLWTEHEVYNASKLPAVFTVHFVGQHMNKGLLERKNYVANFRLMSSTFYHVDNGESKGMKLFYYEFRGFKKN